MKLKWTCSLIILSAVAPFLIDMRGKHHVRERSAEREEIVRRI